MVYEMVVQTVEPERREEHVAMWQKAWTEASFEGSHGVQVLRGIEDPSRVVLLIQWDSVEAHQRHRGTDKHNRFREAISTVQSAPSQIGHYLFEDL